MCLLSDTTCELWRVRNGIPYTYGMHLYVSMSLLLSLYCLPYERVIFYLLSRVDNCIIITAYDARYAVAVLQVYTVIFLHCTAKKVLCPSVAKHFASVVVLSAPDLPLVAFY
ncbi:hypothetical protein Tcan_00165 [Toxocara canis]|uniref:Uncharacterized protein n=1 Tax=Toxocara canis TaxID=6265 RepID=A0A0B2VAM3_TOXCA|nr:hypothetical protein Tcan_00165 [Toxocara canis]